jgi:flagellar hook-associated protein 1 FlgK
LAGDNSIAQAMANKFTENLAFKTAGALPQTATTLAGYGTAILALNSIEAANVNSTLIFKETLVQDLTTSVASVSGVNIDEELAKMILFQNAYSASARLIRVVAEMLQTLIEIV